MKFLKRLVLCIVIILIVAGYTKYVEPKLLMVKKHDISLKDEGTQNLKVVQFTDTHLGEFFSLEQLEKVVEKINSENPDIVVFTGDLMDNASKYQKVYDIASVLEDINAEIGKYAVYGNRDYGGGAVREYENIMEEAGFKVLVNSSDDIIFNNKNIKILGADDALMGSYDYKSTTKNIKNEDVNILITHEPDLIDDFFDYPIDLALTGHSHGGQVYIPLYGPAKKTALAEKYTKGIYNMENERETQLYVNSGIGNTKLPFRLFNIPQIAVFNISV